MIYKIRLVKYIKEDKYKTKFFWVHNVENIQEAMVKAEKENKGYQAVSGSIEK